MSGLRSARREMASFGAVPSSQATGHAPSGSIRIAKEPACRSGGTLNP